MGDDIKLVIKVPKKLVCEGFERPFTEEEKSILIKAIGNGKTLPEAQAITTEEAIDILLRMLPEPRRGDSLSTTHTKMAIALTMGIMALRHMSEEYEVESEVEE